MSEQKKIWMVRIGDHVCGPYETAAVESLIQEQRISEIDEIALPCKGWYYVRDRGEFLDTLESLKTNSFTKQGSATGTAATAITGTENITQLTRGDRTEELTLSKDADTKTTPLVDFNGLGVDKNDPHFGQAPNTMDTPERRKKFSLVSVFVVLLVICGAYFFGPEKIKYNPMALLKGEAKKNLEVSWASGDYEGALKALQGSKSLLGQHRNKYAALLLMRGNEFNLAEKTLEIVTDKATVGWKNLKGLSEQYRGQEDLAESYFLSVLKEDQNYLPSLINLGLLKREAGEWSLARSYFEAALSRVKGSGFDDVSFYLLEAWMRQSLAENGVSNLNNITSYLKNQMVGHSTYMHEFKLIELWISSMRSKWEKSEEVLTKELLDLDPQVLIERKVSPYTYKLPEGSISYLCEDLDLKLKATKYKASVIALCSIINKEYSKAISLLKRESQSEYAVTLYSFVARLEKDILRADEQLVKAMELSGNENFTKFFFQARFCYEKGDMKCAAEYWMKGLDRDPNAYTAHTGLARSYFQVEDYEKARVFMKRAESFSKSYGPLIELQMLMKDVK